jgi:hypothetical protein
MVTAHAGPRRGITAVAAKTIGPTTCACGHSEDRGAAPDEVAELVEAARGTAAVATENQFG